MALIHAFNRKKTCTHEIGGKVYTFAPNDIGHVICDVQEQPAADRFLSIESAFRLYGQEHETVLSPVLTAKTSPVAQQSQITASTNTDPAAGSTGSEQKPDGGQGKQPNESPYVLTNDEDGSTFDLRPLSDEQLHEFAKANEIKVHPNAKGDTIRDKIVEALATQG